MINNDARSYASLSSGLLARKGHARPAMRPQGYVSLTPSHMADDLGWNDMGDDTQPAPVAPAPVAIVSPVTEPVSAPEPAVLHQRAVLGEQFASDEIPAVAAVVPAPVPAPKPLSKGTIARVVRDVKAANAKAAFTLRLDNDRHLRLRLASAVHNRSAQQLVTEALDAFLESLTEVDALARQLDARESRG